MPRTLTARPPRRGRDTTTTLLMPREMLALLRQHHDTGGPTETAIQQAWTALSLSLRREQARRACVHRLARQLEAVARGATFRGAGALGPRGTTLLQGADTDWGSVARIALVRHLDALLAEAPF
jgi:hypothetical protein